MRMIMVLLLAVVLGACTTIRLERQNGSTGSYEKITVKARPKDFMELDFQWHETRLRAGRTLTTTSDPWADMINDALPNLVCAAYPQLCPNGVIQE